MKQLYFKTFLLLFFVLSITYITQAQIQTIDPANVLYVDNTSDNYTGGPPGTFMNDPKYREFPQNNGGSVPAAYGFWSNNGTVWYGGNHRRASQFGSGDNSGANAKFYCSVQHTDYYLVYHHMNSGNATSNAYVKFTRFGEGTPADSFRYNMLLNNTVEANGASYGSFAPLGIIELFAVDSSLTVEIGLDTLSSNTLRVDAVALVRSTVNGPDIEFGYRRFDRVFIDPATGDTTLRHQFTKDRATYGFPETTFKWGSFSERQLTLYNLGSQTLNVTGFVTQTNRFSVTTAPGFSIPPGGKTNITIRYSPLGEELNLDTLYILSNDPIEPEASIPLQGRGINYNFILNASQGGSEPHWNVPAPGGIYEEVGASWLNSTPTPFPYPVTGGNASSRVNTGSDVNIAAFYRFNIPDSLFGKYFLEYSGPAGSSNAAQNVTVDVVTPFYTNPDPALGDTQRVLNFNSRAVTTTNLWARIGGNKVFELNGGGQTVVRFTNPNQGGTELLRTDLLRVRLVPIAPTVSTSLDPARALTFGSVSIYDSIRLQQFNYQRNFIIGSNGETPLRIDTIYFENNNLGVFHFDNLPQFPISLPAIDGEYNLFLSFLPDSIRAYSARVVIVSNDVDNDTIRVNLGGQGVGTGITVDDTDIATFIYPSVIDWTGAPDPTNMDKWYRVTGSGGVNQNRLFTYIYFNPPTGLERVEWFPYFPFRPGSTTNEIDSFDVFVSIVPNSAISSPRAKYIVKHVGPNSPTEVIVNQNGLGIGGGQVPSTGRVYLGRYNFLRGGNDSPGSGTVFGSVEVVNDTALVSAFYQDSLQNTARRDSFVLRADAVIFEQGGTVSVAEPVFTPMEYSLSQNYPNPFNPTTQIQFTVPNDGLVDIRIYDMLGREVATLVKGEHKAGYYTVEWNGRNNFGTQVATGVYIYRMISGNFVQTKKMMMMK